MNRLWIALTTAACVLAGFSSTAMAGYCDDIDNDGVTYDFCEDINMNNLVDTSDPAAVNAMYNISSTHDPKTNTLYVVSNFNDPASRFLPVNPNGGTWSSVEELNDYLTVMLGADNLGLGVDICSPSLHISFVQNFRFYRWNPNTQEIQDSANIIEDAISGWNGELIIDEVDLSSHSSTSDCAQGTDGDLSAEQCSRVGERLHQEGSQVCGNYPEPPVLDNYVQTKVFKVEWSGQNNGRDVGGYHSTGADRIRIKNLYYNGPSYLDDEAIPNVGYSPYWIAEGHKVGEYGPNGVCGFGSTERGDDELTLSTQATYPTVQCGSNPYAP